MQPATRPRIEARSSIMNASLPTPERLPKAITPCPILEAILEVRFTTRESWRTLPGLLYTCIRERYPEQRDLPLAQMPEEFRRHDTSVTYAPLIQFIRGNFIIQFGPRVISLATKSNSYPGWQAFRGEMEWLLAEVKKSDFVAEGERLAARYINFFPNDVFRDSVLGACVDGERLDANELSITTVMKRPPLVARLAISNSAIVAAADKPTMGSVVDLDVWLGSLDFDLFSDGLQKFDAAHVYEKEIFFGLLSPEFTASLSPVYE